MHPFYDISIPQLIGMIQVTLHLHTKTEVIGDFMLRSFLTVEVPEVLNTMNIHQ